MKNYLVFIDMCLGKDENGEYTNERFMTRVCIEYGDDLEEYVNDVILAPFKGIIYGKPEINGVELETVLSNTIFTDMHNVLCVSAKPLMHDILCGQESNYQMLYNYGLAICSNYHDKHNYSKTFYALINNIRGIYDGFEELAKIVFKPLEDTSTTTLDIKVIPLLANRMNVLYKI